MNKNFLFFLLLLSVVLPAQAQPIKGAGQVVKGLTGEGLEKALSSYMHAPGMAGKVAQTQVAQLHQRVLAASKAAFATPFSPAEIRRLTAIKAGSPRLVASIFSAPSNEMVSLLRHEFLTLTGVQKVSVSVEQSQLALHLFRRGLIINTNAFSHLASYTSVAELEQAIKTGKELYGPSALQAFADVSDALSQISTYAREVERYAAMLESDQRVYELAKALYSNGMTSYTDLVDAERTLYDSQMSYAEVCAQQYMAYVTLFKALGGGW